MTTYPRVLLVHGLILSPVSMIPLGARLSQLGWDTSYFTYSSLVEPTARVQRRLAETLSRGPTHVVAHSLGGLMSLETLVQNPELPVSRVVCLGTPLRGSAAALGLHRIPLAAVCIGRSDRILCRGVTSWPKSVEVGMLAGRVPMGLGAVFAGFGGPHDGSVSVDETHVPALAAHQIVDASHTGMLVNLQVVQRVDRFLRLAKFA